MIVRTALGLMLVWVFGGPSLAVAPEAFVADEPRVVSSGGFPSLNLSSGSSPGAVEGSNATEVASADWMATPMVTTCSALAVVLGLFAVLAWVSRRYSAKAAPGVLPSELVSVLGSSVIDAQNTVMLLKVGGRVIVASRTSDGLRALSEITDADEVTHLTATCTGDAGRDFHETMREVEREPASGFAAPPMTARGRSRLFATA